jgi:1,4-alpha-glucan branching enzyme
MSHAGSGGDLERLIALVHPDPHSILGAHPTPKGVVIRALRPDAESVRVAPDEPARAPVPMRRVHPAGLFEARFDAAAIFPYVFEVKRANGSSELTRDAYAFPPTLGELDLHLAGEGSHERLYEKLGAHVRAATSLAGEATGVAFAVWAPAARGVSVVGDWNGWDGRRHPMRNLGPSGIWELFVPGVEPGAHYKFEVRGADGRLSLRADPFAQRTEIPPGNASIVAHSEYRFGDVGWLAKRAASTPHRDPLSIYEVHLGTWRRSPDDPQQPLGYRDLADALADYAGEMGFTHVELMPVMEHPFGGSWGYQVTSYFAPTARYGAPDDLRYLIDTLHRRGIGVILDWVPAHFPKDDWALGRFDGTALFEHLDPRLGEHPDWGTFIFNYGRNEVRNFLLASALYWIEEFHADGLRVDAVASLLYRDYSRKDGEWLPNQFGGRENLEAIDFLKRLNQIVYARHPGVLMIAEESTAWPGVSRPVHAGGLGFGFKWNMGWMHDTLSYFAHEPVHRRWHHRELTFAFLYAWSEHFVLPLSHDEVVHGKGSMIRKMPGDPWQRFANLRALYAHMWAHPGKKHLFMGCEFAMEREWDGDRSIDWHLLERPEHAGVRSLIRDLNRLYRERPALWAVDHEPAGFQWIEADLADDNVFAYLRRAPGVRPIVVVGNFSPVPRSRFRLALPDSGRWREILNSDSGHYGGSNLGNAGAIEADAGAHRGFPASAMIALPPLGVVWLETEG